MAADPPSQPTASEPFPVHGRVMRSFLILAAAQGVAGLLYLGALTLLANRLHPDAFGQVCFAEAAVAYLIVLSAMGLDFLGTRQVARHRGRETEYVTHVSSLRLFLAALAYLLLAIIVLLSGVAPTIRYLLLLYGLALFPLALSLEWLFQSTQQMQFCALFVVLREAIFAFAVLLFVRDPARMLLVPVLYLIARSAAVATLLTIFIRRFGRIRLTVDQPVWTRMLRHSVPIGLSQLLAAAIYLVGTTLLGTLSADREVGFYGAAARPLLFVLVLVGAYGAAVYPVVSSLYVTSPAAFARLVGGSAWLSSCAGVAVALGGWSLAGWIIGLLYPGGAYAASVPVFKVLAVAVGIGVVTTTYSRALLACDGQNRYLVVVALQLTACVVACLMLVPAHGALGAALGSLAAEIAGLCGCVVVYRDALRRREVGGDLSHGPRAECDILVAQPPAASSERPDREGRK